MARTLTPSNRRFRRFAIQNRQSEHALEKHECLYCVHGLRLQKRVQTTSSSPKKTTVPTMLFPPRKPTRTIQSAQSEKSIEWSSKLNLRSGTDAFVRDIDLCEVSESCPGRMGFSVCRSVISEETWVKAHAVTVHGPGLAG